MADYFGKETFKLGFGLMRLPKLQDGSIDIEQVKQMVDMFIQGGGTYFDTAYVYEGGASEAAAKTALVERYPRDSFTIATKLNARVATDEASARQQFDTSLKRLGVDYIDYYLLHAVSENNVEKYDDFNLWEYVRGLKAKGLVRHWGFSFHGSPELLDKLLTRFTDVEFVQLQLNYADWENNSVRSRACWETARKHGVSVTVMEPVKGGMLANPPKQVTDVFKAADPDASPASWAIRYVASLDGIITVLSGMSNIAQMQDNISYMSAFKPLDEAGQKVIADAQAALAAIPSIQCTGCHYCTPDCPMQIRIPEIFTAMNRNMIYNQLDEARRVYARQTANSTKASECLQCGQCEGACPQQLPIIELLKQCAAALE